MDELHEELDEGGVSRRDALKKIGVTAAGFWAVPVISSFTARAYASHQSPVCAGHNFSCPGLVPTDLVECGTGASGLCFCDVDTLGNEGCFEDFECALLETCSPTVFNPVGCPDGFHCLPDNCCGEPKCVPECGTSLRTASATVQSGPTVAGR